MLSKKYYISNIKLSLKIDPIDLETRTKVNFVPRLQEIEYERVNEVYKSIKENSDRSVKECIGV